MGRPQTHKVCLSNEEKAELHRLAGKEGEVRSSERAHMLLLSEEGKIDREIAEFYHVDEQTVARLRKKCALFGMKRALSDEPRSGRKKKLSASAESQLIALACTPPPEGYARWELRVLQQRFIQLGLVESVSYETIRTTLKKTSSNRGKSPRGASLR